MLKPIEAKAVVEKIYEQVKGWGDVFAKAGVSQQDIDSYGGYVLRSSVFIEYVDNIPLIDDAQPGIIPLSIIPLSI